MIIGRRCLGKSVTNKIENAGQASVVVLADHLSILLGTRKQRGNENHVNWN